MNYLRTSYGAKDKHSSVQRIHIKTSITFLWEKTAPLHLVIVDLTAGRLADEIRLGYKILKILYRLILLCL